MSAPAYVVSGLRRVYPRGGVEVRAVDGVDLVIDAGELVAIEGASGSGKSSLLAMLGGLDRPSQGTVHFHGADLARLADRELTALRGSEIGFVFQGFNLVPTLTAQQNVEAAMAPLGLPRAAQHARALELLDHVGLGDRSDHLPSNLSGGEQQRVAIARALANRPSVLLADEPTGNLDSATATQIVDLLRSLTSELGVTVVLVTHDADVAGHAARRIEMRDGQIRRDSGAPVALRLAGPVARPARLPATPSRPAPRLPVARPTSLRRPALGGVLAPRFVASAAAFVALAGTAAVALGPAAAHGPACSSACAATGPTIARAMPAAPKAHHTAPATRRAHVPTASPSAAATQLPVPASLSPVVSTGAPSAAPVVHQVAVVVHHHPTPAPTHTRHPAAPAPATTASPVAVVTSAPPLAVAAPTNPYAWLLPTQGQLGSATNASLLAWLQMLGLKP